MKKTAVTLAALVALALPATAMGQISIGARAGTLGLGGEASFALGRMLAVRGGVGVIPYEFESDFEGINYTISPPDKIWNIGLDVYPFGGGFRISGGILNRPGIDVVASGQQTAEVGNQTYTGNINIDGLLTNESETAPYATIGFGRASGRGIGFFMDLGAALMGDASVQLTGSCTETSTNQPCPNFQAELQREEDEFNAQIGDLGSYVKLHPIFQIGIKIGF